MSSLAVPVTLYEKSVTSAAQSVRQAKKRTSRLAWIGFLSTLPHLRRLTKNLRVLNRSLAIESPLSSAVDIRQTVRKLQSLAGQNEEVRAVYDEYEIADVWPYSSALASFDDSADYLSSIIEGYQFSLDSDFCEVVKSTVTGLRAVTEPSDCRAVQ